MSPETQWLEDVFPISPFKKDEFVSFRVDDPRRNLTSPQRFLRLLDPKFVSYLRVISLGSLKWVRLKYDTPAKTIRESHVQGGVSGITPFFFRWRTLKLRHTWTCESETWSPAAAAKTWCRSKFLKRFPYKVAPWSVTNGITTPINGQKSMDSWGLIAVITPVMTGRGHLVTSSGSQISWWACRGYRVMVLKFRAQFFLFG